MECKSGKVVFKHYKDHQLPLFTPSLDSLIPDNHLVRLINSAVEQINLTPILESYQGGVASSYHPCMLLKALIYAYSQKVYS